MKKKMLLVIGIIVMVNTSRLNGKALTELQEAISDSKIAELTTHSNLNEKIINKVKTYAIESGTVSSQGGIEEKKIYNIRVDRNSLDLKKGLNLIFEDKKKNFDVTAEEFENMKMEIETLKFDNDKTREFISKKLK